MWFIFMLFCVVMLLPIILELVVGILFLTCAYIHMAAIALKLANPPPGYPVKPPPPILPPTILPSREPFIPSPTPPPSGFKHAMTNAALVAGVFAVVIPVGLGLLLVIDALSH